MSAPKVCLYCDGHGNSDAGGACGFCDKGRPLDTEDDWTRTWGRIIAAGGSTRKDTPGA